MLRLPEAVMIVFLSIYCSDTNHLTIVCSRSRPRKVQTRRVPPHTAACTPHTHA